MKVRWTEFDSIGYNVARETIGDEVNTKDFEKEYTGDVIDKYHTFWGIPKFVVAMQDGRIKTVRMDVCVMVNGDKDGKKSETE